MSDDPRQLSLIAADGATAARLGRPFDPARLTQARSLAALTKAELASSVGVSPAAIGQFEAGAAAPRPEVLAKIADTLEQTPAFFLPGRPHARLDASMAHFRSLRSTRVRQRAKAVAFVEQVWELQYALEKRIALPPVDLPGYGDGADSLAGADPLQAAKWVRQRWALPPGPLTHLVRTLEVRGVIVTLLSLKDDSGDVDETGARSRIDAFSTSRLPRPIIVLTADRANDVYRSRFTAAHELGHLLLHRDVTPGDLEQEREANRFAAELLTPTEQIAPELSTRVRLSALQRTAQRWGVSAQSLVLRSRELGLISEVSARRAYQKLHDLQRSGATAPEPITSYPGETPSMMRKAYELAETHGLTLEALGRELAWPVERVTALIDVDPRPRLRLA
ncbi:MAG: XRE family transcriptional regulator [Actinobacteria bacterium]|nr:XRE family transcriptional regulator [Actinomycetota bacterium]MCA1721330.1 XRE family transcriptional regulator [Actinomycetota bacterium]